ncbi:OmpA family protein [Dyella monticola]|uniref:OmpA family protein n=1 Tax=Dyella monticola TaxID=1927958 RepID=A0A370X6C2_9GAMM|nr:OmpA family protein [Dyella monticola]RDS83882.1 OmpA family protein [Dyella monticola]
MSAYPYRLQILWITLLVLTWLGYCSPWSGERNLLLGAVMVLVTAASLIGITRRARTRRRTTARILTEVNGTLRTLPSGLKRHTPLVITVGDPNAMSGAWGDDIVRITDAAIWVRCDMPVTLMHVADALKRWRNGQGPDAVALLIAADQGNADTLAAAAWKPWRSAIGAASRAVGYTLPACLAVYAQTPWGKGECPWFGTSGSVPLDAHALPDFLTSRLQRYALAASPAEPESRGLRFALLDALVRWSSKALWPLWADGRSPLHVMAFGVTVVPGVPVSGAPFGCFVAQLTGLTGASTKGRASPRYPLPDALLAGMPRQPIRRAWPRALAHAVMALTVFFGAGTVASADQNRTLMKRLADNLARYQAIPSTQDAVRLDALALIKHDRDELEHYANAGVPMRLDFGLYRGSLWVPIVDRVIADYRPPAAPPSMIELNSMSMFNTGSAVLNPGSNRALVGVLEMIKSHPDKRVLIAGHTDSVGSPDANLKLSLARAAAVRDWLIDASGLSATRFAIQGYGDTRPRASNDIEAGRALNRRVEITLIPDCRDDGSDSTKGHPACS